MLRQDAASLAWAGTGHQPRDSMGLVGPGVPVGGGRFIVPARTANVSSSSTLTQQRLLLKQRAPGFQDGTLRISVLVRCHNRAGDKGL